MNYFQSFQEVKPDPILGLAAKYKKDPNPNKINLTIGVYKSEEAQIALFRSVHEAEKLIWDEKLNKGYPPIDGTAEFKEELIKLVAPEQDAKHFYIAHTVGATSALRLSGELMKQMGIENIFFSDLTWPNHPHVFKNAGLKTFTFPYYNASSHELEIEAIYKALNDIPEKSAVLFQMSCHNPTGMDPNKEQWTQIIQIIKDKNIFPIIDCAYQGFGQGLQEDVLAFKLLMEQVDQAIVCYSCAKNFGLYGERVGALIAFDKSKKSLENLGQNARVTIRGNYSTPPIHGARIVKTILQSQELSQVWSEELTKMRLRVKELRQDFLKSLEQKNIPIDFKHIIKDQGLFSLLALPKDAILKLREEFGVYILDNGRINIAGLCQKNMEAVTSSIQKVITHNV